MKDHSLVVWRFQSGRYQINYASRYRTADDARSVAHGARNRMYPMPALILHVKMKSQA